MIDVLTKLQTEMMSTDAQVDVIILRVKNLAFKLANPWEIKILGKSMLEWVKSAVDGYQVTEVDYDNTSDVLGVVKPYLKSTGYTLVLYSDTPLMTKKTVKEIIDHVLVKQCGVCKLTRGYVFNNEYVRNIDKVFTSLPQYFDEEDFITAYNNHQLYMINDIMKGRIISFHTKNGVRFVDTSSVYIESGVVIRDGVEIYPNNYIAGTCLIDRGTKLMPNNCIENSIIGENCEIVCSEIKNSKIPSDTILGPFEKVIH